MKRLLLILSGMAILCSLRPVHAQNVAFIGSCDTPDNALSIVVSGPYAYLANGDAGLRIVDVSDPFNPTPAGSLQTEYPARDICVSGNYAFVANGASGWFYFGGLEIVDISDPAAPDSVGVYERAGDLALHVSVSGSYAYLTVETFGIEWSDGACLIIDTSVPSNPSLLSSFGCYSEDGGCTIGDVFASSDYAYVFSSFYPGGTGLLIENIANPEIPFDVGHYSLDFDGIFVAGDYAYLVSNDAGLQIFDVSSPSSPYPVSSFETPGQAREVYVYGNYAYVADGDSGLQVIDVTDPANPVFAGSYDTPDDAQSVYIQGDYVYVADYSSLMILQFTPQSGVEEIGNPPRQFVLNQNYPNPFNAATSISYSLAEASEISFDIYDLLGRKVQELLKAKQTAGEHQVLWNAGDLPSGIYFARLHAGSQSQAIRMTLLK